jgi:predicted MFS family arabinose efflux permease
MWSAPKRYAALYSILFFSLLCNFCITGLAPGFGQLEAEFKVSITDLTYLISVGVLGEGMGCFTIAPLAKKIGKRPIWLSTVIVFFFCNIWASCARSYPSLLVARLLATWAGSSWIHSYLLTVLIP